MATDATEVQNPDFSRVCDSSRGRTGGYNGDGRASAGSQTIDLERGWWSFMQKGINKLINILEGKPEQQFNSEGYMMLCT